MEYHIEHERRIRRGWNNNLSLINHSICDSEISWSMMLVRNILFIPSTVVILPFKAVPDARMLIRMSTTFSSVRTHSRWFSMNGDEIVGDERIILVQQLVTRVIDSFGWFGKNLSDYKIRRYRLNWILINVNHNIDSSYDIHHLNALRGILAVTDDRISNLKCLKSNDHYKLHHLNGDVKFVDYRLL